MRRRVTLQDVAQEAGVSPVTVSYVISGRLDGPSRISSATQQRVLAAAERLDYVPNQSARNLRRRATRRVCLSLPRLGVPAYDAVAESLQTAAAENGYHLIVNISRDREGEEAVVRQVRGGLSDALILMLEEARGELAPMLGALARSEVGVVAFSNALAPDGYDVVRDTDLEACYEGVRHLIGKGHARIACLALRVGNGQRHSRVTSYFRALEEHGLPVDMTLVRDGAETRQLAYGVTRDLLELPEPPTAIFACTDVAALSAMQAVRDAGLRVPQEVAVVGAGNIIEGELASPPLTTVGPDEHDYRDVWGLLYTRFRSKEPRPGRVVTKPWSLKVRGST